MGETEACSAGLDLGFRMRSLAAEWRDAGSRGRGFWEDSDGITRAGEARLEKSRGGGREAAGGYCVSEFDESSGHVPGRRKGLRVKDLFWHIAIEASAYRGGRLRLS